MGDSSSVAATSAHRFVVRRIVTTIAATPSRNPSHTGPPSRTTKLGSDALSPNVLMPSLVITPSHLTVGTGPATTTPTSVAPTIPPTAALTVGQCRCTSGNNNSGASVGFNAMTNPR